MKNLSTIHGVLPDHQIRQLIDEGILQGADINRIQPASIDLVPDLNTLMQLDYFTLPKKGECIEKIIQEMRSDGVVHDMKDLTLNAGSHYLVRMKETLADIPCYSRANPKSSTGRTFNHCRLLCDRSNTFDEVPIGHKGNIWMLCSPKFSPIGLDEYEPLNQLRFFVGDARLTMHELYRELHINPSIVRMRGNMFDHEYPMEVTGNAVGEVPITVDLRSPCYRTRLSERPLDLSKRDNPFQEYYELIDPEEIKKGLLLEQNRGYLIGTNEEFSIPQNMAMEVIASDKFAEIQPDFAGFGDPRFIGKSLTLEIISYEKGLFLRHGQYVATVRFEYMRSNPNNPYKGNYHLQELGGKLPKYVR